MKYQIASILFWFCMTTDLFGQTVTLVDVKQMDNDQHVLLTLVYQGTIYEWSADIPKGIDAATHIQTQTDRYMSDIYRNMYQKAPNNIHSLTQWEAWIADGTTITLPNGVTKVVKKRSFKGKHPKSIQLNKDIDASTLTQEMKDFLKRMLD